MTRVLGILFWLAIAYGCYGLISESSNDEFKKWTAQEAICFMVTRDKIHLTEMNDMKRKLHEKGQEWNEKVFEISAKMLMLDYGYNNITDLITDPDFKGVCEHNRMMYRKK